MKWLSSITAFLMSLVATSALACAPNCPAPPPLPNCTSTFNFTGMTQAQAMGGMTHAYGTTEANWKTFGLNGTTTGSGIAGAGAEGPGSSVAQTGLMFAEKRTTGGLSSSLENGGEAFSGAQGAVAGGYGGMLNTSTLKAWENNATLQFNGDYAGSAAPVFTGGFQGESFGQFSFGK